MNEHDRIAALRRAARNLRRDSHAICRDLRVTDETARPTLSVVLHNTSEAEARCAIAGEIRRLRRTTRQ